MTTTEVPDTKGGKLGIDRANSIGWLFIERYYEMYNSDITDLYKLYSNEASVSHGGLKKSEGLKKANDIDSIKLLFEDLKVDNKNRIIIIDADIQVSHGDSILIIVNGEWSKNGSPYYQFHQTFVLCKGATDSNFDIANDILRFIDYDYKHELLKEEPKEEPKELKEEEAPKEEPKETKEEPVKVPEESESTESTESTEPEVAEKEEEKEDSDQGPFSWAALAATAKDKSPVITRSPSITKPSQPKPQTVPQPTPNGKFRKEDWFPIYVRGCEDIPERELKEHLTREFGEIKFFKQNANIALVDFLHREGQKKALDAHKTKIKESVILLEIRESKSGKKEVKKEKVDVKRKVDKKPVKKVKNQ